MWKYSLRENQIEVRKSKAEKHIGEWKEARCKKQKIDKEREREKERKREIVVSTRLHIQMKDKEKEKSHVGLYH